MSKDIVSSLQQETSALSASIKALEKGEDKDAVIASLRNETAALKDTVAVLQKAIDMSTSKNTTYYASGYSRLHKGSFHDIPENGTPARFVSQMIESYHLCDFRPQLNTSSYVNVTFEKEEREVAMLGAEVNLADASVYPASIRIHDIVVNLLARLWNAPEPPIKGGDYCGAGTVGSTEACLLAGLALKFRWRKWYAARHGLSEEQVQAIKPNLVITSAYQAAWEKLFRYFDVDPILVKPNLLQNKMSIDPVELVSHCNEKTIGVVAVLGNHYNGNYDPVWDVDAQVTKLNQEKGWQIGIHVDAASGGFIAPFQTPAPPPFDFRLPNVLSISSSGHKFGESVCGTGWVVWRERKNLAEHISISVSYLGGHCDSFTLNFSRPASGPYVQFYKLLRLGKSGYRSKVANQMHVASYIRNFLRESKHSSGKPRFQLLDGGDECCLPAVAARLNPELSLNYDDIDLQHALSASHWYVSGYSLGFENFSKGGEMDSLFSDVPADATMFRIVCKSNLTQALAEDLTEKFDETLQYLDSLDSNYQSIHRAKEELNQQMKKQLVESAGISPKTAANVALAAGIWKSKKAHRRRLSLAKSVC